MTSALRRSGYAVDSAADGEAALGLIHENTYDVIVLDIMLPRISGLGVLRQLREAGRQDHVLLLTARDTVADRVDGLRQGADDYLIKPFALDELLARIEALCRRHYQSKDPVLRVADLEINTASRQVRRSGRPIELTAREYALLEYLVRRRGEVVARPEIEEHIYDGEVDLMSNVVDSAICSLRKKISPADDLPLIHTRRGQGYVLEETGVN